MKNKIFDPLIGDYVFEKDYQKPKEPEPLSSEPVANQAKTKLSKKEEVSDGTVTI
jgi:hypothetical protein